MKSRYSTVSSNEIAQLDAKCNAEEFSKGSLHMAQWKLSRGIKNCEAVPHVLSGWVECLVNPAFPRWLRDKDSPHYETCQSWCYMWPQNEFISRLRDEATSLSALADSGEDQDDILEDIAKTMKFASQIAYFMKKSNSESEMAVTSSYLEKRSIAFSIPPRTIQIEPAGAIYQCVPCLPEVTKYLQYELIEANPKLPLGKLSLVEYLGIPLAVVEYVNIALEGAAAAEHHKDHLLMAMSTACSYYTFLKLRQPVFGYLIDTQLVEIFIAWHSDSDAFGGETTNNSDAGMSYKSIVVLDMKKALHCLAFRLFLIRLTAHGATIKDSYNSSQSRIIQELKDGTFYRWRMPSVFAKLAAASSTASEDLVEAWLQDLPRSPVDEA